MRNAEALASLALAAEALDEPLGDARRTSVRWPVHAEVELIEPAGASGIVINVSGGGLRVAIDRPLALGEHCVLRVCTADGVTTEHARVVWCRDLADGSVVGLEFVAPS